MLVRVFQSCQNIQGEPQIMLDLCNGDVSRAMTVLATSSTVGGLLQFIVNPTLGGASDTFGRKTFLKIGPAFNILSNGFIAMFPSNFWAFIVLRTLDDAFTTLSGSTTTSAAISDCASGPDLAIAMSKMGSYIGAGCFLGPVIGDTLLGKFGYRAVYASKCAFAVAHLLFNSVLISETLPKEQRRPMSGFKSPLSFTELFTNGAALRKLSTIGGLQTFTDGKNVNDLECAATPRHAPPPPLTVGCVPACLFRARVAERWRQEQRTTHAFRTPLHDPVRALTAVRGWLAGLLPSRHRAMQATVVR
jgi:MFS family permease